MNAFLLTAALLVPTALALPAPQTAPPQAASERELLDVPPCVYAADAVRRLTRLGIIQGFPTTPAELAQNAVRQVFAGLQCGDIAWTTRFLSGVPQGYATGIPVLGAQLRPGFEFTPTATHLAGDAGTVTYHLRYREGQNTVERTGTARVARTDTLGWQVEFASLTHSGLPFFPDPR